MDNFSRRDVQATRKARRCWCWWCGEDLPAGSAAVRYSWVWEGDFACAYLHPECAAGEERIWSVKPGTDEVCQGDHFRGSVISREELANVPCPACGKAKLTFIVFQPEPERAVGWGLHMNCAACGINVRRGRAGADREPTENDCMELAEAGEAVGDE